MKFPWILLGMIALNAQAGNELGNGGDGFAQEFTALGRQLVQSIEARPDPRIADVAPLKAAVEKTRVTTSGKLELRGAEVDAINYPAQAKIEVNRARWKEYDVRQKASLVLHEYLGIAGIDDGNYQISSAYLELPVVSVPGFPSAAPAAPAPAGDSRASVAELVAEPSARRFSVNVGTNYLKFGGNMGRLYGDAVDLPLEARLGYLISPRWSAKLSAGTSDFLYTAMETGFARVSLQTLSASAEYHLNERAWNGQRGLDPYASFGLGEVFRKQDFKFLGQVQKDLALVAGAGLGLNWFLLKGAAVFVEGRISTIFFKDRYDMTFAESGIADTTGPLYAANVGFQYFF
jgi:hypothetical protein